MTKIAIVNPATGELIECNVDGLTQAELEALPLNARIYDELAREIAPCLPEEFLAAYVARAGAVIAGITIIGEEN